MVANNQSIQPSSQSALELFIACGKTISPDHPLSVLAHDPVFVSRYGSTLEALGALVPQILVDADGVGLRDQVERALNEFNTAYSRWRNWAPASLVELMQETCVAEFDVKRDFDARLTKLQQLSAEIQLHRALRAQNVRAQTPSESPLVDGPVLPNRFVWHGQKHRIQPLSCRLLKVIWECDSMRIDELKPKVWGRIPLKPSSINTAIHRANNDLYSAGCGIRLDAGDGYINKSVPVTKNLQRM